MTKTLLLALATAIVLPLATGGIDMVRSRSVRPCRTILFFHSCTDRRNERHRQIHRSTTRCYPTIKANTFFFAKRRTARLLTSSYVPSRIKSPQASFSSLNSHFDVSSKRLTEGMYQPFVEYAWNALQRSGLLMSETINDLKSIVPTELQNNTCVAKGMASGCEIKIQLNAARGASIRSKGQTQVERHSKLGSRDSTSVLKLARYAHLETVGPVETSCAGDGEKNLHLILPGIHVLNFVIFPHPSFDIPVFGADLVSLPGNKHLILIDFQPVRYVNSSDFASTATAIPMTAATTSSHGSFASSMDTTCNNGTQIGILNLPTVEHLHRLQTLHTKYSGFLEWGGDIPQNASRFFSPYAIWTRFRGDGAPSPSPSPEPNTQERFATIPEPRTKCKSSAVGDNDAEDDKENPVANRSAAGRKAIDVIQSTVFEAFQDYLNLYIDVLWWYTQNCLPRIGNDYTDVDHEGRQQSSTDAYLQRELAEGHRDYLKYRKLNDPARPMLQRLFGADWTERAIHNVLFNPDL